MSTHEEKYLHVKKKTFYYFIGVIVSTYFLGCVNYKLTQSLETLVMFSDFTFIDIGCAIFIIVSMVAYISLIAFAFAEIGND